MNKPRECERLLLEIAGRLEKVLRPNSFRFQIDSSGHSSAGPYSMGFFSDREIRIGLVYRWFGFGCVTYEINHECITHDDMMQSLGFDDNYILHYSAPDMISMGKNGEDAVESLIHDLEEHFIPRWKQDRSFVLQRHNAAFRNRLSERR